MTDEREREQVRREYRTSLAWTKPESLALLLECDRKRADFAAELHIQPLGWTAWHIGRFLRATGERPERVRKLRVVLGELGMDAFPWPGVGGVFEHGGIWGRGRDPWGIVGHPHHIDEDEAEALAFIAREFPTLAVFIDDRPGYYVATTHHVRIELHEVRPRYRQPPSTPKTRAAKRAAKRAFAEEGIEPPPFGLRQRLNSVL